MAARQLKRWLCCACGAETKTAIARKVCVLGDAVLRTDGICAKVEEGVRKGGDDEGEEDREREQLQRASSASSMRSWPTLHVPISEYKLDVESRRRLIHDKGSADNERLEEMSGGLWVTRVTSARFGRTGATPKTDAITSSASLQS